MKFTPIQKTNDGMFLKRDDLYSFNGVYGGKVRTCRAIASTTKVGLITAGARKSPQMQIVARIAAALGLQARCHTACGEYTAEMVDSRMEGAEIIQHKPGHNSVIINRAYKDFKEHELAGWAYVPFGMECPEAVKANRRQVENISWYPNEIKRVVIVLGSGMSASGVLHGMRDWGMDNIPVLGIQIGADPVRRLDRWAPMGWRNMLEIKDITETVPYAEAVDARIEGVVLDPHYEAKCVPFLRKGDLFWIVGARAGLT